MNFSWVDGFDFAGKLESEQNATLSPRIYIQDDFFKYACAVLYNTSAGEEGQEEYPQMSDEQKLERKLLQWEKYGLAEFYDSLESQGMDTIKIAGITIKPEWGYMGLYSAILAPFMLILSPKFFVFCYGISLVSIFAGLGGRLSILLIMKYYRYRMSRLLSLANKEVEENKNFKKAEKYYARLLETKKTVEKLLDISIITGTEENLGKEDKRRFEFKNIIEGIIEPSESSLRNKGLYEKTDKEENLTFPVSYLWDDKVVPWKEILKKTPEEILSAGTDISKVQTDYLERLKELIWGIKKGYVVLNGPKKLIVNIYVLEMLLDLIRKHDWDNPLQLLKFDRSYMELKERNDIISTKELRWYYEQMSSRAELAISLNRLAVGQAYNLKANLLSPEIGAPSLNFFTGYNKKGNSPSPAFLKAQFFIDKCSWIIGTEVIIEQAI